jgi:formylglycine-generating enzyme required for sulfatase activity
MGPTGRTVEFEGVEFVEISPGYFRMGSHYLCDEGDLVGRLSTMVGLPWGRQPKHSDACPVHWVEFSSGLWVARTEITNQQYERFDPEHRRSKYSLGDLSPVVEVEWRDTKRYCAWLSKKAGVPVRLPSESEWECACRAGSSGEYHFGDDVKQMATYGWCSQYADQAHEVATRRANAWGLHDFHGNVFEWCEDTYHPNYEAAPADGTAWTEGGVVAGRFGTLRVHRGGAWNCRVEWCRAAERSKRPQGHRGWDLGFRPVFNLPPEE